jgi:sporulation integral membrane protein YlbJ
MEARMAKKNSFQIRILIGAVLIPILVALFNVMLVLYPKEIFESSKEGLALWFTAILPALLPFLIGMNLLTALGVTNFVGTILEPIMRPLFKISGSGGFALVCGMCSGYPVGAKITSNLRENGSIERSEANRLISFSNNCGPIYILGAVGAGLFKNISVGYFIMFAHYVGSILTGLILARFSKLQKSEAPEKNIFKKALKNMREGRAKERLTAILGASVTNAVETVLVAAGYIVLFSVAIRILETTVTLSFKNELVKGLVFGLIEMSEGVKNVSGAANAPEILAAIFIISFGGFCVHTQALGFIEKTDISVAAYIGGKFLCAVVSALVGLAAFPLVNFETPVFLSQNKTVLNLLIDSTKNLFYALFAVAVLSATSAVITQNATARRKRRARNSG